MPVTVNSSFLPTMVRKFHPQPFREGVLDPSLTVDRLRFLV